MWRLLWSSWIGFQFGFFHCGTEGFQPYISLHWNGTLWIKILFLPKMATWHATERDWSQNRDCMYQGPASAAQTVPVGNYDPLLRFCLVNLDAGIGGILWDSRGEICFQCCHSAGLMYAQRRISVWCSWQLYGHSYGNIVLVLWRLFFLQAVLLLTEGRAGFVSMGSL